VCKQQEKVCACRKSRSADRKPKGRRVPGWRAHKGKLKAVLLSGGNELEDEFSLAKARGSRSFNRWLSLGRVGSLGKIFCTEGVGVMAPTMTKR